MLNILLSEIFDVLKKEMEDWKERAVMTISKHVKSFQTQIIKKKSIQTPLQFILNFDESLQ